MTDLPPAATAPSAPQGAPFTVYYVVGRPRTGSTFVGDWIARQLNILNAGEVWQTMREFECAGIPAPFPGTDRWADPAARQEKRRGILADPFWSKVMASADADTYAVLVGTARQNWQAMVDCSKTDAGIARYKTLGCEVVVIHTVRAFSTWSKSVRRYRTEFDLPGRSAGRLLVNYLRINRRLSRYRAVGGYHAVPQERLGELDRILPFAPAGEPGKGGYERHEMFGTPDFQGDYSERRAAPRVTRLDRFLYTLIGISKR